MKYAVPDDNDGAGGGDTNSVFDHVSEASFNEYCNVPSSRYRSHSYSLTYSLTHWLTYSLTHWLTHSHTHLLTYSLTY